MTEIHIPPEVIEAAAAQIWGVQRDVHECAKRAITAALAAWPGMKAIPSWDLLTHERRVEIVLPIIRTEAST